MMPVEKVRLSFSTRRRFISSSSASATSQGQPPRSALKAAVPTCRCPKDPSIPRATCHWRASQHADSAALTVMESARPSVEMLVFIKAKSKHVLVDEPTGEKTTAKLKPTSNQTQINPKKTVPWRLPSSSNDFSHARPTPQALINALYMEVSQATCVLWA